ncbi:hypothetical protein P389DRAFT_81137 [Cystobasidium minutum MCA 4210]|uniref:uncharacterized protein n=1 Tax=Cystobasidium minutum MCA 4210 TaxID=1397322 RepID=UPI0034CE5D14|eukprot:jgi/Rhomi1/81137/CE81136_43
MLARVKPADRTGWPLRWLDWAATDECSTSIGWRELLASSTWSHYEPGVSEVRTDLGCFPGWKRLQLLGGKTLRHSGNSNRSTSKSDQLSPVRFHFCCLKLSQLFETFDELVMGIFSFGRNVTLQKPRLGFLP